MPGRTARKSSKRTAAPRKASTAQADTTSATPHTNRLADLEAECRRLAAELEAARARIGELEHARDQALDRIAWVVDSLQDMLEQ